MSAPEKKKVQTVAIRMLVGAIFGAVAIGLFIRFVGKPFMDMKDPATAIAVMAGVSYMLIGLMVGIGTAAPRIGARFLNVEAEEELREEMPKLMPASAVFVLTGLFLLLLAIPGSGTLTINRELALAAAALCLAGIAAAGWLAHGRNDELTKKMGQEVASITLQATMLLLGGWAALAQFGYIAWLSPLALLSALVLLQLFVSFIVIARKGMMMRV